MNKAALTPKTKAQRESIQSQRKDQPGCYQTKPIVERTSVQGGCRHFLQHKRRDQRA